MNDNTVTHPYETVSLRLWAWELYVANYPPLKVKDKVEILQRAREELGMPRTKGGNQDLSYRKLKPKIDLVEKNGKVWKADWRRLYLPSHRRVRGLSDNPVILEGKDRLSDTISEQPVTFNTWLRHTALPSLTVFIGRGKAKNEKFGNRRGVYFLRTSSGLYIGQSTEFGIRNPYHLKKREVTWWCFVTPTETSDALSLDSLNATESLLISFWNEICHTENSRSADQQPASKYLQEAVLMVEAASAILIWLVREKKFGDKDSTLPFKGRKGGGWADCYLEPFNESEV